MSDSKRVYLRTDHLDLSSEESIRAWADQVWVHLTNQLRGNALPDNDITKPQAPSTVLTDRYVQAIAYANHLHGTQVRKGTTITYMCHVLGVSSLVLEAGGTEDEAIGALLHDAAEDAGGEPRLADIQARFGPEVEAIVRGCSDSLTTDSAQKPPWGFRKAEHLKKLRTSASESILLVTAADKLHNARAILTDVHESGVDYLTRFTEPGKVLDYYQDMLEVLQARKASTRLTEELARTLDQIKRLISAGTAQG